MALLDEGDWEDVDEHTHICVCGNVIDCFDPSCDLPEELRGCPECDPLSKD